jgi:hypothetical protein
MNIAYAPVSKMREEKTKVKVPIIFIWPCVCVTSPDHGNACRGRGLVTVQTVQALVESVRVLVEAVSALVQAMKV